MSGEQKSYVQSKLDELDERLKEQDITFGLFNINYNSDVDKILSLNRDQLESLQPIDCANFSFQLEQHSIFIQQQINKLTAQLKWALHNLDVIIAKEYKEMPTWMKIEEKRKLISKTNSYAKELDDIILDRTTKIENINFLATRISNLSKSLDNIRNSKVRKQ